MRLLELIESYLHLFPSVYSEHHFISFVYNSPSDPEGKEHVFPELAHQFLLYKSFTVLEWEPSDHTRTCASKQSIF